MKNKFNSHLTIMLLCCLTLSTHAFFPKDKTQFCLGACASLALNAGITKYLDLKGYLDIQFQKGPIPILPPIGKPLCMTSIAAISSIGGAIASTASMIIKELKKQKNRRTIALKTKSQKIKRAQKPIPYFYNDAYAGFVATSLATMLVSGTYWAKNPAVVSTEEH